MLCKATSSVTGAPCKRHAIQGGAVCAFHGGSAPQVRMAADRRVAQAKAGAFIAGLGIALEDRDPHQELSRQLSVSAGVAERVQELVAELEDLDQAGEVHPLLKLWAEERDRVVKTAKVAVSAGVKERAAQLTKDEGALVAELVRATFNDPRLGLTPAQKDEGLKAFARRTRVSVADPDQIRLARQIIAEHERAMREDPDRPPTEDECRENGHGKPHGLSGSSAAPNQSQPRGSTSHPN